MKPIKRRPPHEEGRASVVELFFDLVFVLAVTQLSSLLVHDLTLNGAAKTLFLLLVAWWAWMSTTWMTNWFDPDTDAVRAVLLVGMLASMMGAIAIPDAFGDRGFLLVIGYVGLQTVRNAFVVLGTDRRDPLYRPVLRILTWNAGVAIFWIAGALFDDDARVAVWLMALVLDYAGPFLGHWTPRLGRSVASDWELEPAHFTERITLFVIIALGESIIAAGVTASGLDVTATRMLAVVVAFCITAVFWWLYFDYHAEQGLATLKQAAAERGRLGRDLSYVHVPLVAGIIVSAVASELVIAHPKEELGGAELLVIGGGPVLYLLGSLTFKARVLQMLAPDRIVAAVLVTGAAVLGTMLPALATWTIVLAILTTLVAVEYRDHDREEVPPPTLDLAPG